MNKYSNIISQTDLKNAYDGGESVKIVSIIRQKSDAVNNWLSVGIGYTNALVNYIIEDSLDTEIVQYQKAHPKYDVFTGEAFSTSSNSGILNAFGTSYTY